jgi:XTP/dITP diphosphohydrolase
MHTIVFATSNPHKVSEVNQLLAGHFEIKSLSDIGCHEEIPETSPTIPGNALQKARYVYEKYKLNCFSEDTGLEIEALDGEPGVYSARYAGPERDSQANMALVLQKLAGKENRNARFRTVVALIIDGQEYLFEGIAEGTIIKDKRGDKGFGYDPIFQPVGQQETFAEMDAATKNEISHRGKAIRKLTEFLMQR